MSHELPSYSTISLQDPPSYSQAIRNQLCSSASSNVQPGGSMDRSRFIDIETRPLQTKFHFSIQCMRKYCVCIWLLFVIFFSLLHLVVFLMLVECASPAIPLRGIRTFCFLHISYFFGTLITCSYQRLYRETFTGENVFLVTTFCFVIPIAVNVPIVIYYTMSDLVDLSKAIGSPLSVTTSYPCTLSFYRLAFGLMVSDYVGFVLILVITIIRLWLWCTRTSPQLELSL